MIQRTTNPNNTNYANYGGRGISVCSEWRVSFTAFARDMADGFSPELTLERIDVNGDYSPGNCRWATRKEQARNRRDNRLLVFRGHAKTLGEWAEVLGFNPDALETRLARGWSVERMLTTGADPDVISGLEEADA
ncbi:hypothetical protein [Streptomyces sp. NBC_01689]|uniref:hypothetical protein n=1 Tax=Streptomyces sp. NBC_01689 TaxID=2975911 RepID=UPI002E375A9F|nr:hypothetical protein [Streptomyces sp. NBC_01689]